MLLDERMSDLFKLLPVADGRLDEELLIMVESRHRQEQVDSYVLADLRVSIQLLQSVPPTASARNV